MSSVLLVPSDRDELLAALDAQAAIAMARSRISKQPTARGFLGVAFTVGTGEETDPTVAEHAVQALASDDIEAESRSSGIGWGGDSGAVSIVLRSIEAIDTYGGGAYLVGSALWVSGKVVRRAFARLRRLGHEPDMSLGAISLLCAADLHDEIGDDAFGTVSLLHAEDMQAGNGATLGHSGTGELYLVLFGNKQGSWAYIASSRGRLLHRSKGSPLPWTLYWPTGYDPLDSEEFDSRPEPPELYDWSRERY